MAAGRGPPQREGPRKRCCSPTQLPSPREFPDPEEVGSKKIEIENKHFLIYMYLKTNEHGRFVDILEMQARVGSMSSFHRNNPAEFLCATG